GGKADPPQGFVDLGQAVPSLVIDLRYFGSENFVGRPIKGYEKKRCYATKEVAEALRKVQAGLSKYQLGLKVFDAYRPQRAVDDFVTWARDRSDVKMKGSYYPNVAKKDLIPDYIAPKSGHSRGSAIDVTLVDLSRADRPAMDMGSRFDFFDSRSHSEFKELTSQQRANRLLLRKAMEKQGFKHLAEEWWHFSLVREPYPKSYFDFPVR
ncbi:MAG: M15 family metallopeptidase, partial [Verrucomicrobiota bacterium]